MAAAAALALAVVGMTGGCATRSEGPGGADVVVRGSDFADEPCSMVDEAYYETSRDLENASDAIVHGTITSIEVEAEPNPTWVVGFDSDGGSGGDGSDILEEVMGESTIHLPKVCGEAAYGETFAVGAPYILLLVGESGGPYYPVNTTQGVIPIVDGRATPLARASVDGGEAVTISYTMAASMGAPFPPVDDGVGFVAGEITPEIPDSVVPQFSIVDAGAAWSPDPGVLWVFTAGSSSCPTYASAQATEHDSGVRIVLSTQLGPGEACLADLRMYTTRVAVPDSVDESQPLSVFFAPDGTLPSEPSTIIVQPRPKPGAVGPATWAMPSYAHHSLDADNIIPKDGSWAPGLRSPYETPTEGGEPTFPAAGAAWTGYPGLMYVFTWGSSSCPVVAISASGDASGVAITLEVAVDQELCTEDFTPTTSVVAVPEAADSGEPITVQLGDLGSVVVEPRGPDYEPDKAWVEGEATWLMR